MGALKFFKVILKGKEINDYGKETTIEKMAKNNSFRVCIDANYIIYSSILAFSLQPGDKLTSGEGKFTMHINTILNKVLQLNKNKVKQVWIFDSPNPNPLKASELKRRAKIKEKSKDLRGQFKLTSEHIKEVQELLSLMGVCWIETPNKIEAEQYGAWMTKGKPEDRFCQYMISGDSDVLLFGGNLMRPIKKKSSTGKSSKTVYSLFDLDTLLEESETSVKNLIKIGITMGTDFNKNIAGIGVKTVEKKVKSGDVDEKIEDEHKNAMKYFMSDISDKVGYSDLHIDKYDEEKLLKFLGEKDFNVEKIKTRLKTYKQL